MSNPDDNVAAAVQLYNNRIKAGQDGFADWAESKDRGAFGGWGSHVNDSPTDSKQLPFASDPGAGPKGSNVPTEATPAQVSVIESFFNKTDVPWFIADALVRNGKPYTNFPEAEKVWTMVMQGKSDEVAQHYNLFSPDTLKNEAENGDPIAGYFLRSPKVAGVGMGLAEFANPVQQELGAVTGEVAGPIGRNVAEIIAKTPVGAAARPFFVAAMNKFSPFMEVAVAGGAQGKAVAMALANNAAGAPARAAQEAISIFGKLSKEKQDIVVQLYQSALPITKIKGIDPAELAELQKRAAQLGAYISDIIRKKASLGISDVGEETQKLGLFPNSATKPFPMKGAAADPLEGVQGSGVGHGFGKWGEEADKTYAQHIATTTLSKDFSVAEQIAKWGASSLRRIDLNQSLQHLPSSLLQDGKGKIVLDAAGNATIAGKVMFDGAGKPMMTWKQTIQKFPELAHVDAPILKESLISPALAKFLSDRSTLLYESVARLPDTTMAGKVANAILSSFDHLTEWQRRAIIANPIIHPGFNLANNAKAAGLSGFDVAGLVTKSLIATFIGPNNLEKFMKPAAEYTQWVEDATAAGAVAELKQGNTRLLSTNFKDLNTADKVRKAVEEAGAWNARSTFGKYGEAAFATTLYQKMVKSGRYTIDSDGLSREAAQAVREALGNYQNVSKTEQATIGRLIFFYPWLKGNILFWVRKFVGSPAHVGAPEQAARANNLLVGDPSETDRLHPNPAKDFQWINKDSDGSYVRWTPMLPQRMLEDPEAILSGDLTKIMKKLWQTLDSRATPGVRVMADWAKTAWTGPQSTIDPRAYDAMYDKNAPLMPPTLKDLFNNPQDPKPTSQIQQFARSVAGELAPIPLLQGVFQQALRRGISPGELKDKLVGASFGDYAYKALSKNQQYKLHAAMDMWNSQVKQNVFTPNAQSDVAQRRLEKYYMIYARKVRNILHNSPDGEPNFLKEFLK
jgi:hypothetical protein